MNSKSKTVLAVAVGVAVGAAAMQGIHAQTKTKAYTISELEILDAKAQAAFSPRVQAAQSTAGGRNLRTAGGKVVALEGAAPKLVALTEWDSLEAAEAFYKSKAWTDLRPRTTKWATVGRDVRTPGNMHAANPGGPREGAGGDGQEAAPRDKTSSPSLANSIPVSCTRLVLRWSGLRRLPAVDCRQALAGDRRGAQDSRVSPSA